MNPLRISVIAVILCFASSAFAEPLKIGIGLDKAMAEMKAKNYKETGLEIVAGDESNDLMFWEIDDGVLIAGYSKKDRKVTSLSFWFADDRSKLERQEFNFTVISFDPDTGVMTLQTKKK